MADLNSEIISECFSRAIEKSVKAVNVEYNIVRESPALRERGIRCDDHSMRFVGSVRSILEMYRYAAAFMGDPVTEVRVTMANADRNRRITSFEHLTPERLKEVNLTSSQALEQYLAHIMSISFRHYLDEEVRAAARQADSRSAAE